MSKAKEPAAIKFDDINLRNIEKNEYKPIAWPIACTIKLFPLLS